MNFPSHLFKVLLAATFLLNAGTGSSSLFASEISIAVASNFDFTLDEIKQEFEKQSSHTVRIIPGSTAQHYAAILRDAPYDIFLSDDDMRAAVLERNGKAIAGTRFTYAQARLVLWSVNNRPLGPKVLQEQDFQFLALANPQLDPFGKAAQEFLQALDLWDSLEEKIIIGENIGQTYHFAISGDVDMALIAFQQIIYGNYLQAGSYWPIPDQFYSPINQQAVLLTEDSAAREFMAFMQSPQGREIIISNGFYVP